ncbi:TPA: hypothetical protein ACH3X1_014807 [Trebouxia sp. C0004]
MAPAGMLASVSSMPLQQTLVDRSFCAQSRQTGPASSKDDSKQRKSSRQYTPREVAAIAAAWVEYKPVLEGNCKSAPDKKKAWQMFQQKAYELEPSLLPDFSQLSQLKSCTLRRLAEALVEEGPGPSKKAKTGSVSAWVSSVLGQIPKNVPMEQVQQFLTLQVSPIPCSMDVSSRLVQSFEQWEGQVKATGLYLDGLFGDVIAEVSLDVLAAAASAEGVYVGLSLTCARFGPQGFNMKGSEQMTLVGTEICIGHTLEILRVNAPTGPLSLRLDHDRDSTVSNTSSASYAHGCRPDSYFIVNERLLLVGEDKVNSDKAVAELERPAGSLGESYA